MEYKYNDESLIVYSESKDELKKFLQFLVIKGLDEWFSDNWIRYEPQRKIYYIKFFGRVKEKLTMPRDLELFNQWKKINENL